RPVGDTIASGELLIRGRPAGEGISELAQSLRRFTRRKAARGMPDADHTMGRRGAKARRQAVRPAIEHLVPRRVLQLLAKERAPIGEPAAIAECGAPVLGRNVIAGLGPR